MGSACRPPVGQIDKLASVIAIDVRMRWIDEVFQPFEQPVIAPCLAVLSVHALLDNDPLAVISHDEAVQVKIKDVVHGGAVDLGDEAA